MIRDRSSFQNYFLCVGVTGVALIGIAMGLTGAALTGIASNIVSGLDITEPAPGPKEFTVLDLRMQNLREIRQTLANPVPPPGPLPQITARTTRTARTATIARRHSIASLQSRPHKLMDRARKVFVNIESPSPASPASAYAEIDPHAIY
jgi:hypothetical protein